MKIYVVEDIGNSPGKVYAVLASEEDAFKFAHSVEVGLNTEVLVEARTLFYGQPPVCGYNE
jgi:hypothetical protein